MGAGAVENYFFGGHVVYQEPIGLDMALPHARPLAFYLVRTCGKWERDIISQTINNQIEPATVVPAFKHHFKIAIESPCKPKLFHALLLTTLENFVKNLFS